MCLIAMKECLKLHTTVEGDGAIYMVIQWRERKRRGRRQFSKYMGGWYPLLECGQKIIIVKWKIQNIHYIP